MTVAVKPPDVVCPKCGGGIEWSESTGDAGEIGSASCFMHEGYVKAELRNDCRWRGWVFRLQDGSVRVATDDEIEAGKKRINARFDWS